MSKSDSKSDFTQGSIFRKIDSVYDANPWSIGAYRQHMAQLIFLLWEDLERHAGLSAVSTGSQVLNLVTFVITQFAMGITVLDCKIYW